MELNEIKKLVNSKEYDFLKTNEHLGNNVCLLALGGSHAYGMNNEHSDLDIRGCTLNTGREILTGNLYEQFDNSTTDTVIYSFNKIISLLSNCNPNVIEILGCKKEHYLYVSEIGHELIDNKHLFLSKRCINSFGGYANQQLRRLQNAMARDSYAKVEREKHILGTIKNMKYHLSEAYPQYVDGCMEMYIDKSSKEDMETEIFMNFNLKHFPLRDYRGIMSEMNTVINEYSKLNKRNKKKDEVHLAKHMAHLLRLYFMAIDILEKQEIITYREDEHQLLVDTRNSKFLETASDDVIEKIMLEKSRMEQEFAKREFSDQMEEDLAREMLENDTAKLMLGIYTIKKDFFDILNKLEERFEEAKKNTKLPDEPDYEAIGDFKEKVNGICVANYLKIKRANEAGIIVDD